MPQTKALASRFLELLGGELRGLLRMQTTGTVVGPPALTGAVGPASAMSPLFSGGWFLSAVQSPVFPLPGSGPHHSADVPLTSP